MNLAILVEGDEQMREPLADIPYTLITEDSCIQRSRSLSFTNILNTQISTKETGYLSAPDRMARRRSTSMRLHVSIPASQTAVQSPPDLIDSDGLSSQSESPQTPATISTPIAGVVDLTKDITTISQYPVAQGGLSDIYLGEWHRTNEETREHSIIPVAIKRLRVLASRDNDGVRARKRLNREVYVWHRLEHPNVVKLFGTSYHMAGRPAMIMQWYKNGNAAEYLSQKKPDADRVQLILDVARGLEHLHTMPYPIVHADLKGNNVLITDEGVAALCDFGLSQVVEDLGRPEGLTFSNPNVGPVRWQAPELLDDDSTCTTASDVWSFSCTAFELLTSKIPYSHRTRDVHVMRDMHNGVRPPSPDGAIVLEGYGPRIRALLESCWSFDPQERPTMTAVRRELESIQSSMAKTQV